MKLTILLASFFLLSLQSSEPGYPGGPSAWTDYLNHNLHFPVEAIENGVSGTVIVDFIVHLDSTVSDIHAVSGPKKGGLREEAIRVITASGKWVPAVKNGSPVEAHRKEPIKFVLMK
ncbi:energy transducer TonB [Puia sp. P3]|uniref:energy transducer TonB n=1 Tax=Puia sp. P3 TaxID=3423952 RepID=UPI003D6798A3